MSALVLACVAGAVAASLPWWAGSRVARLARETPPPPTQDVAAGEQALDVAVLLALIDAAVASGAGVPRALEAVGHAVRGPDGRALVRAAAALALGADWSTAWTDAPVRLAPVAGSLAATWSSGAAPGPALRAGAEALVRERRTLAREAAGRLGVRLVLPLGLCFLPAFVLIGLVPVLLSVGAQLVR